MSEVYNTHLYPYDGFEDRPHPARYTVNDQGVRYNHPRCLFCFKALKLDDKTTRVYDTLGKLDGCHNIVAVCAVCAIEWQNVLLNSWRKIE